MSLRLVPSLKGVSKGLGTIQSSSKRRILHSKEIQTCHTSQNSVLSALIGKQVTPYGSEFNFKNSQISTKKKYSLKGGAHTKKAGAFKSVLSNRILTRGIRGCCSTRLSQNKVSKERINIFRQFSTKSLASDVLNKCKLDSKQIAAYQSQINKLIDNVYKKEKEIFHFSEITAQPLLGKKMLNSFSKVWNSIGETITPVVSSSAFGASNRTTSAHGGLSKQQEKQNLHSILSGKRLINNFTIGTIKQEINKRPLTGNQGSPPIKNGLYKYVPDNHKPSPMPRMSSTSTNKYQLNAKSVSEYVGGRSLEDSSFYEDRINEGGRSNIHEVAQQSSIVNSSDNTMDINRRVAAKRMETSINRTYNPNSPRHVPLEGESEGHNESAIERRLSIKPLHMLEIPPTLQQLMQYKPVQVSTHVKSPSYGNILQAFDRRDSEKDLEQVTTYDTASSENNFKFIDITERLKKKAEMEAKRKKTELAELRNHKKSLEKKNERMKTQRKKQEEQEVYIVDVKEAKKPEFSIAKKSRSTYEIEQTRLLPSIVRSERLKRMSQTADFNALKKKKYDQFARKKILTTNLNTGKKPVNIGKNNMLKENVHTTKNKHEKAHNKKLHARLNASKKTKHDKKIEKELHTEKETVRPRKWILEKEKQESEGYWRFKVNDEGSMDTSNTSFRQSSEKIRSSRTSEPRGNTPARRTTALNNLFGVREVPGLSQVNPPQGSEDYAQVSAVPIKGEQNVRYVYRVPSSTKMGGSQPNRQHSNQVNPAFKQINLENEVQIQQDFRKIENGNELFNQQNSPNSFSDSILKTFDDRLENIKTLDHEIAKHELHVTPNNLNKIIADAHSEKEKKTEKITDSAIAKLKARGVSTFDGGENSENALKSKALSEANKKHWKAKGILKSFKNDATEEPISKVEGDMKKIASTDVFDQTSNNNDEAKAQRSKHFSQNFKTDDTVSVGYPSRLPSFLGFKYNFKNTPIHTISTLSKQKPRKFAIPQTRRHFSTSYSNHQEINKQIKDNCDNIMKDFQIGPNGEKSTSTFLNYTSFVEGLGASLINRIKSKMYTLIGSFDWITKSIEGESTQYNATFTHYVLEDLNKPNPSAVWLSSRRLLPVGLLNSNLMRNDVRQLLRHRFLYTSSPLQTCNPSFLKDYQRTLDDDKLPSERLKGRAGQKKQQEPPPPEPIKANDIQRRRSYIYGAKKGETNTTADMKMWAYHKARMFEVGLCPEQGSVTKPKKIEKELTEESATRAFYNQIKKRHKKNEENDNALSSALQRNKSMDLIAEASRRMNNGTFKVCEQQNRPTGAGSSGPLGMIMSTSSATDVSRGPRAVEQGEGRKQKLSTLQNNRLDSSITQIKGHSRSDVQFGNPASNQQKCSTLNEGSISSLKGSRKQLNLTDTKNDPKQVSSRVHKCFDNQKIPSVGNSKCSIESTQKRIAKSETKPVKRDFVNEKPKSVKSIPEKQENIALLKSQDTGGQSNTKKVSETFVNVPTSKSVENKEKNFSHQNKLFYPKTEGNANKKVTNSSATASSSDIVVKCERKMSNTSPLGRSPSVSNVQHSENGCEAAGKGSVHQSISYSNLNQAISKKSVTPDGRDHNRLWHGVFKNDLDMYMKTPEPPIKVVDNQRKRFSARNPILESEKKQVEETIQPRNYMAALNKSYECKLKTGTSVSPTSKEEEIDINKQVSANNYSKTSVTQSIMANQAPNQEELDKKKPNDDQCQTRPLETQKCKDCDGVSVNLANTSTKEHISNENASNSNNCSKNENVTNVESTSNTHRPEVGLKGGLEKNQPINEVSQPSEEFSAMQKQRAKTS